ncbi:MAG: hypothetical protein ACR2RF_26265 [Geminicoccaceae bacterium]
MCKVKLTDAEISALECNGVFEDLEDRYLPGIVDGRWLHFTECAKEAIWSLSNDISNSEDAIAEDRSNDPETRRFARLAAAAMARLSFKVSKAT